MKPLFLIGGLAALIYLQSCGGNMVKHNDADPATKAGTSSVKPGVPVATSNLSITDEKDLTGYWAGIIQPPVDSTADWLEGEEFNMINFAIEAIDGNSVKGHIVLDGKVQQFNGDMQKNGTKYQFTIKGVAEDKHSGTYKFSIARGDTAMKGVWINNKDTADYNYSVTKKLFAYNPNWKLDASRYVDYNKRKTVKLKEDSDTYEQTQFFITSNDVDKYNASADVLTKEQVANLKKADILVMRNSIYARHGYTFKKPLLNTYFSQQSWYVPISTDVTAELTPREKKNIELLMRFEKNAKEYYDTFGR